MTEPRTFHRWDDGTVEVTLKFATIIAVVIALAIGFDAGHFIWP